ncbi:MAG: serine/threonine protein kinase [Deltaproteobacteria bacterium]|nr:serine/threonine protein kinase [Deltaproteobacteria bacterium]
MHTIGPGSLVAQAYRVVRRIGKGGMGTVYEAIVEATGERVAIKIPHDCFRADGAALKRFVQEARATLFIRSPHVVCTMAVGRLPTGMPFLAMEYVDGISLREMVYPRGRRMLPLKVALVLIDQIASGLSAAHEAGVVHRDLKPSNVLVTSAEDCPRARIFDFGLSLLATETAGRLTLSGVGFGTPEYMAPEQIRNAKHVDGRADVYSLAVMAYEMLTQKLPFDGVDAREVWHRATHDQAVPLSKYRANSPAGLSDVIMRAMSKDADARPPSAEAFRRSIAPYLPS